MSLRRFGSEDASRFFLADYGQIFMRWLRVQYRPMELVEEPTSDGRTFTIELHEPER